MALRLTEEFYNMKYETKDVNVTGSTLLSLILKQKFFQQIQVDEF